MSKKSIPNMFKKFCNTTNKYSPEILMGFGIAGTITATIMAVRATPKALLTIDKKKEELNVQKLEVKDVVAATWKCYISSVAVEAVSIACLIGASSVNFKRRAALATAYTLSETAFKEYQEKVIETMGEKKEESLRDSIAKEKVNQSISETREVIITEKGNTLCLDAAFNQPFKSDIEIIRRTVNDLNLRLRDEMFISLNDFYYELGIPLLGIGDDLGWNIENGNIELDYSSQLTRDGKPCLVINYRVSPRYDYRGLR